MLNPASPTSASCLDPTPENLHYPPKRGDYVYFETPPFRPGEPTTVSLSRAADASMLAYARFFEKRSTARRVQITRRNDVESHTPTVGNSLSDRTAHN
jgi:hypothetical protein